MRYVLDGSVRKAGGRVRITAQLIDATTGAHLWADRFDGLLEDIFALQDKVAVSVAGVIEPTLEMAETRRLADRPTNDLTALDFYLRALPDLDAFTKKTASFVRATCSDKPSSLIRTTGRLSYWRPIVTQGSRSTAGPKTRKRPGAPASTLPGEHFAVPLTTPMSWHSRPPCSDISARTSMSRSA